MNEMNEEIYELFEGDIRKLDELIGQLELWSDEYTVNHKKEEIRLPQYIELHYNLEELKKEIFSFIEENSSNEDKKEYLESKKAEVDARLDSYKVTEETIHDWIREIKSPYSLIANSPVLTENREYLESVLKNN